MLLVSAFNKQKVLSRCGEKYASTGQGCRKRHLGVREKILKAIDANGSERPFSRVPANVCCPTCGCARTTQLTSQPCDCEAQAFHAHTAHCRGHLAVLPGPVVPRHHSRRPVPARPARPARPLRAVRPSTLHPSVPCVCRPPVPPPHAVTLLRVTQVGTLSGSQRRPPPPRELQKIAKLQALARQVSLETGRNLHPEGLF